MDDVRVGRVLRQLRARRRWRQVDLAEAAGISQSTVSLVERGHLADLSVATLRRIFGAVDARFESGVVWRGGLADRLIDERHSGLVGAFAVHLNGRGWEVAVEVSFSEYGERGSIDILALRPAEAAVLVVEVKSVVMSMDDTIRRLDVKHRLAPKIVLDRYRWRPMTIGRLLVVEESATNRRRIARRADVLEAALPQRGPAIRDWIRSPSGNLSGIRFLSPASPSGTSQRLRAPEARNRSVRQSSTTRVGR